MLKVLRLNLRTLNIQINSRMSLSTAEVDFKKVNNIGCITLNRPKQLNALNLSMVKAMQQQLDECERDNDIKAVVVKGAGETAFCAGGDVKTIREKCLEGDIHKAMEFFREEYFLNHRISNYKKPYIAFINGITMGGGVGISVHGKYRIATEKTLFAMPETAIGFFADVGGSYFLSRLHDSIGIYLVLTGYRLKGKDVRKTGIATHYMDSKHLANLENELYETKNLTPESLNSLLGKFDEKISEKFDTSKISPIFSQSSIEDIIKKLEAEGSDWAKQQLSLIHKMSPISQKVAVRQLKVGAQKNLKECLEMEYQLCLRFTKKGDFLEGVRAVLIDRGAKPNWHIANISEVDDKLVDWFFEPQPDDEKLVLPNYAKL